MRWQCFLIRGSVTAVDYFLRLVAVISFVASIVVTASRMIVIVDHSLLRFAELKVIWPVRFAVYCKRLKERIERLSCQMVGD